VNVRVWDVTQSPVGTAVFLAEPAKQQRNQTPVCMLNVDLSDAEEGRYIDTVMPMATADTSELCRRLAALPSAEGLYFYFVILFLLFPLMHPCCVFRALTSA